MTRRSGFLTVMMEPPPALEEEFNDWYDTEHVPERKAVTGFDTATRFVCLDGWPRYLAFYDLRDADVIGGPGYASISGTRFSPWSKRILSRVRGLWRAHGEQVYPGQARTGPMARLLLLRFNDVARALEAELVAYARSSFEGHCAVRQVRVVRNLAGPAGEYLVLIELLAPVGLEAFQLDPTSRCAARIDVVNMYAPYWARGAVPGVIEE